MDEADGFGDGAEPAIAGIDSVGGHDGLDKGATAFDGSATSFLSDNTIAMSSLLGVGGGFVRAWEALEGNAKLCREVEHHRERRCRWHRIELGFEIREALVHGRHRGISVEKHVVIPCVIVERSQ